LNKKSWFFASFRQFCTNFYKIKKYKIVYKGSTGRNSVIKKRCENQLISIDVKKVLTLNSSTMPKHIYGSPVEHGDDPKIIF